MLYRIEPSSTAEMAVPASKMAIGYHWQANTACVRLLCGERLGHIETTVEQHFRQMVWARGLAALWISTWESLMGLIALLWEDRWCVLRCMWMSVYGRWTRKFNILWPDYAWPWLELFYLFIFLPTLAIYFILNQGCNNQNELTSQYAHCSC